MIRFLPTLKLLENKSYDKIMPLYSNFYISRICFKINVVLWYGQLTIPVGISAGLLEQGTNKPWFVEVFPLIEHLASLQNRQNNNECTITSLEGISVPGGKWVSKLSVLVFTSKIVVVHTTSPAISKKMWSLQIKWRIKIPKFVHSCV